MNKSPIVNSIICIIVILVCSSCQNDAQSQGPKDIDFSKKFVNINPSDSLISGSSYLSVYSDIYSYSEKTSHNLTATISIRNMNESTRLFIKRAEYFDTSGQSLANYVPKPIGVAPLETINIIINETDESGGTGANFIFDWAIKQGGVEPLFEAVMISTKGQQGLSFTTTGHRIN